MSTSNMKKPFALIPLLIVVAIGIFGIYGFQGEPRKAEVEVPAATSSGFSKALAKGPMAGFIVHAQRKDIAPFTFADAKGQQLELSKWKGRVVVLNLWATWCAPCRKEMPDLAKLANGTGRTGF